MESLLANYGSDDEEDEQAEAQRSTSENQQSSLFPPPVKSPRSEADPPARPSIGNSLFSSLPPPRLFAPAPFPLAEKRASNQSLVSDLTESRVSRRYHDGELVMPVKDEVSDLKTWQMDARLATEHGERSHGLATEGNNGSAYEGVRAEQENDLPFPADSRKRKTKGPSIFGALPPPKSTGPPTQSGSLKRIVEFRPFINKSILQSHTDDDDDDYETTTKHRRLGQSQTGTGLAAILPPPKHIGATLGSGAAGGGRRATLESPVDNSSSNQAVSPNLAGIFGETHASVESGWPGAQLDGQASMAGEWSMSSSGGQSDHYPINLLHASMDGSEMVACNNAAYDSNQDISEASALEGYYNHHYCEDQGTLPASGSYDMNAARRTAQDPLASMLRKEKRRSGKDALPTFVEVKQSDLTSKKVREDQLRTTGIAFGPAYRPVSLNKDKPSKLHRRKHQIGSLYFDMRQKEMELIERRAKGNMTKSVTQAKYGW